MYKVFVNDRPIILTEKENFSTDYKKILYSHAHIYELIRRLTFGDLEGICLICSNLKDNWRHFQSHFTIQKSAGGKVFNPKKEVLFIYRFDKWDLPKGKLEKNEEIEECAVREVEEECGVRGLKIIKKIDITYHIFDYKDAKILKETHWFLMHTDYDGKLVPQEEEGILKAVFKDEAQAREALQNTYQNIRLLFN